MKIYALLDVGDLGVRISQHHKKILKNLLTTEAINDRNKI